MAGKASNAQSTDGRLKSLEILLDPTGEMLLQEAYDGLIENIQKNAVSMELKNTDLSGDPTAGTVEAKRFANATSQDYGTARTAGSGNKVKGKTVTIPIDINKEFVEEVEQKDVSLIGVDGLVAKRSANHLRRLEAELDKSFFECAKTEGTQFKPAATVTALQDQIEASFVTFETMKTDYIDGIDRDMLTVVCSPETYSEMRKYLDTVQNSSVNTAPYEFGMYHGVRIINSNRLPSGVKFITMMAGSIAQPLRTNAYSAEKIPMSEAFAIELFYWYGVKAVTPETILWFDGTFAE